MEKIKLVASIIQTFIKAKYDRDIPLDIIAAEIKVFDNGKFFYNCHHFIEMLEQEGVILKLDQFKEDFKNLITIYSFFIKKDKDEKKSQ